MPVVSLGAIMEVSIRGRVDEQTCISLFHYRLTDGGANPTLQSLYDAFNASLNSTSQLADAYTAACALEYQCDEIRYQLITPTRYVARGYTPLDLNGDITGGCMPSSVSVAITKRSDIAGRHGLGTLHMPGVPRGFVQGSSLTGQAVTQYGYIGQTLLTPVQTTGPMTWRACVFQRTSPENSVIIVNSQVHTTTRTMRRRVVGRGQ